MKKYYSLDAGSMYPAIFVCFCLSPENFISHADMPKFFPSEEFVSNAVNSGYEIWSKTNFGKYLVENKIVPIPVSYRQSIEELKKIKEYKECDFTGVTQFRGVYYFKQNPDAILVKAFEEPMKWKAALKEKKKNTPENSEFKKIVEQEYDSSKRFNNSGFGGSGNIYNVLFKLEVFNSDTFLARDCILYLKKKAEEAGYELVLIDTDSFVIYAESDITKLLNGWAMDWAIDKYGNYKFKLSFTNEGYYRSLYVGGNCRYIGYMVHDNGEEELKIRGLQMKRKSSTVFQKVEQKAFFEWLLQGHTLEEIILYIEEWIKKCKKATIIDLATPCRFSKPRENYGKQEEFFKAYDNTQKIYSKFVKQVEEKFYYIQVEGEEEVLAFEETDFSYITLRGLNYKAIIEKQIFNLLVPVFAGLNWGKELLLLAEKYDILLGSEHRNTLLEEYSNFEELKKYFSAKETKNRLHPKPVVEKVKKTKKAKPMEITFAEKVSTKKRLASSEESGVQVPNSAPKLFTKSSTNSKVEKVPFKDISEIF